MRDTTAHYPPQPYPAPELPRLPSFAANADAAPPAGLRVSAHYATGFEDLVAFLNALASDWRGWEGERFYESLEHDLRLTATQDGHVHLGACYTGTRSTTSQPHMSAREKTERASRAQR